MTENKESEKGKIKETFWAIKKGYCDLGIPITGQLIIAAIEEFKRSKKPCYITNEQFAYYTKDSVGTIKKVLDILEENNIIGRETTMSNKGKQRLLTLKDMNNWSNPIVWKKQPKGQNESKKDQTTKDKAKVTGCPIKDNIKDNNKIIKDNYISTSQLSVGDIALPSNQKIIDDASNESSSAYSSPSEINTLYNTDDLLFNIGNEGSDNTQKRKPQSSVLSSSISIEDAKKKINYWCIDHGRMDLEEGMLSKLAENGTGPFRLYIDVDVFNNIIKEAEEEDEI